ncbi:MAG: flagellar protein FlgN [Chlamydiales bacterium]|jgi:flagellar biosynthesis/type III secretory pathway chaperone|nr:flagellar protein FlgN [Chlamydiales bacterium]
MVALSEEQVRVKQELIQVLKREINYLRELSSSVSQEQQMILENNTKQIGSVITEREELLTNLVKVREKRIIGERSYTELMNAKASEDQEIQVYFDQVSELLKRMHNQTFRNSYLLKSKVLFARDLFEKVQPKVNNLTYSSKGTKQKKEKVSTVTIINKEV